MPCALSEHVNPTDKEIRVKKPERETERQREEERGRETETQRERGREEMKREGIFKRGNLRD